MPHYLSMGLGDYSNLVNFIKIHWRVSLLDALIVVVAYVFISLVLRNRGWIKNMNSGWVILLIFLPLWQGIVEFYSVYILSRWAYASSMPLIFGIGILPLLQMLILPGIAIILAGRIVKFPG